MPRQLQYPTVNNGPALWPSRPGMLVTLYEETPVVGTRVYLYALAAALTDSKIDRLKNLQVWDSDFILISL